MLLLPEQSSLVQGDTQARTNRPQKQQQHDRPDRSPTQLSLRKLSHEFFSSTSYNCTSKWQNYSNDIYIAQCHNHRYPHLSQGASRRTRNTSTFGGTANGTVIRSLTRLSIPMLLSMTMMMMIYPKNYCWINALSVSSSSLSATSSTFLRPSPQHQRTIGKTHRTRGRQEQSNNPDRRTILVIRILDTPEDSNTTIDRHETLREVLLDGGGDATMPSVQKQMHDCSGNSIVFVPQTIPDTNDGSFIVDIVVNPSLITDQSNRNEWVEVMASIACDPSTGPLRNLIGNGSSNGNVFTLEPDDDFYFTSLLRQVADHVIVLLPGIYPDVDFIATAEINNRISMYAVSWGTSLSTYMHELAHNLGLRHSGDTIYSSIELDTEYGDSSGYMGESMMTPWTPQKCYNAAQHWQLGWFPGGGMDSSGGFTGSFRLSLSDTTTDVPSLPLRIHVAAFVDYRKLVSNTYDESFVILIQVSSNIYLQYNGAKEYNIGTDVAYANRIVIIEQDSVDLSTKVLASIQSGETYVTLDTSRVIQVCDIMISDVGASSDVIDFATIAISDSHTTSTITSVCQDGPDYVSLPSAPTPIEITTTSPTEPPTASTIVVAPSIAPVEVEVTLAPTTNVVEETSLPTAVPTVLDSNTNNNIEETQQPTRAPIVAAIDKDTDTPSPTTSAPSKPLNLRGPTIVDRNGDTNTTAKTNESSAENGLSTSSIIYSVFGTVMGAILIAMVALLYLTRHSKATDERQIATNRQQRPSTRPKAASSRSKRQSEQQFVGSSRTMKSQDGSPTSRHSDHERHRRTKDDVEERSKSTVPSATTRSSSQQKPKLVLEKEKQPAVTTTCFHKSNKADNEIVDKDDDDSSDDDDQSDTLSVILQQEIWKDRVHKILQSVFFVQDKDGTVTQMMPAPATNQTTSAVRHQEAGKK